MENEPIVAGTDIGYDSCYDSGTCVHENLVDQRFGDYVEMM